MSTAKYNLFELEISNFELVFHGYFLFLKSIMESGVLCGKVIAEPRTHAFLASKEVIG
jgi:hypothetical protein